MACDHLDPYTFKCALSQVRCVDTSREQCKPKFSKKKAEVSQVAV